MPGHLSADGIGLPENSFPKERRIDLHLHRILVKKGCPQIFPIRVSRWETIPECDSISRKLRRRRRKAELLDSGGLNCTLNNALVEGGPRNGVLTGIEDFLQASELDYLFINLPLYFGLGIMVVAERVATNPTLKREMDDLQACMAGRSLIELNERFRLNTLLNHQQLERELLSAQQKIADLESALEARETGKHL